MILPARADWPPNSFTPRRLLSLSRPLRDEPPAFLCAMSCAYLIFLNSYLAFGAFFAPALAGAAFSVDPVSAFAFAGAAFFAGFSAPAALALSGAGLSVGVPMTSFASCASCWTLASSDLGAFAGAAGFSSVAFGAAFFDSF